MVKKIVADWKINEGAKFREIKVYTYNYNEESITSYGKEARTNGNIIIYKTVSHIQSGDKTIYKTIEAD